MAQLVKNLPVMRETWVQSLGWEDPLEKGKATHSSILAWRIPYSPWDRKELDTIFTSCINMGFPDSSVDKESTCNAGDLGLIPGSGRSTGEGIGYPLQYS